MATRKEAEAEGTAGMDDRRNDGRGAWMASEGAGHGSGPMPIAFEAQANLIEGVRPESPEIERCPKPRTSDSEPSGHSAGEQRRARRVSGEPQAKKRCQD